MEEMALQWQEMQNAFRRGYVMTFRECYYAPGMYTLDASAKHPAFVERMFPSQYAQLRLMMQLDAMKARYQLLPSHPNN